jgi:hypothetical protein
MKVSDLLRLLRDDRWFLVATHGSHRQFGTRHSQQYPQAGWREAKLGTTNAIRSRH